MIWHAPTVFGHAESVVFIILFLWLCREERGQFIRLKYTDRKFMGIDVDDEAEMACLEKRDSDEEKLLTDSTEVIQWKVNWNRKTALRN